MATFATEFFAVQKALGITVNSMGDSGFKAADAENADRIQMAEKEGFLGVFVDGKMVVCNLDGQEVDCEEVEMKEFFGI